MTRQMLITGGTIVNEGRSFKADLLIEDEQIVDVITDPSQSATLNPQVSINATGCYVLPGIIDTHVHFREPGLTE